MLHGSCRAWCCCARTAGCWRLTVLRASSQHAHAASSRRRTWDTCWSTSSSPTRPRPERTQAVIDRIKDDRARDPGRQRHGRDLRPVDPAERVRVELRHDVHHARRLRQADDRRPVLRGHRQQAASAAGASEITDATIMIFGPPPVRGVGRAGGFMIMIEDRGDLGPRALQAQTENLVELANQQPELVPGATPRSSGPTSRRCSSTSTARRLHAQGGQAPGRLPRRSRSTWARSTSTTSTSSAAPGRSSCRPRPSTATRSKTSAGCRCATRAGRWCPLGARRRRSRDQRAAGADPVQHVPGGLDQRQRPARRQLGAGDRRDVGAGAGTSCPSRCPTSGPSWPTSSSRPATRP